VLRNQVGAVVILLVEMLAIEPVLLGLAPHVGRYGPQSSSLALLGGGDGAGMLPMWAGALVFLGYAALLVAAGMLLERERDIT
jgi:hypothetical protein